jgi:phytoene synthase
VNSVIHNSNTLDYCINKAIPDGSNLYYATLFEPEKNKNIIISLHALLHELTDIIHECSDPGIARIKLHWWHEEIERLFQQQPRHPVTRQLMTCLTIDQTLISSINSIIGKFEHFLFVDQVDSLEGILSLYDSTSGELWQQCAIQLKANTSSLKMMRDMGTLYQYIRCLQQPTSYITETRCIIPLNIISQDDLLNFSKDRMRQTDIFSPLLIDLRTRLEKNYNDLKTEDKNIFEHGLILNRLALKTCNEVLNDGCKLLNTNISLTPLRKLWIAWRTHFIS